MNGANKFAWAAAAISISLTASLALFGIWRIGYPKRDERTGETRMEYDDGIMWMFLGSLLWCLTSVVPAALIFFNGYWDVVDPATLNPPTLAFVRKILSLSNSLCFVLATANFDAVTKGDESILARFLAQVSYRRYRILAFILAVPTILRLVTWLHLMTIDAKYDEYFDGLVSTLTIFLLTWGFFKSFRKRGFPIIALLSVAVFSIFLVAQLNGILPKDLGSQQQRQLLAQALFIGTDGMVSLLFIALTFSWVYEKYKIDLIGGLPDPREDKGRGA